MACLLQLFVGLRGGEGAIDEVGFTNVPVLLLFLFFKRKK